MKAASETVKVIPAQALRPAWFIRPGKRAPKNGRATMKKRDTVTPKSDQIYQIPDELVRIRNSARAK